MIIECPECHTRYRTENSLEVTEATLFECSRNYCGHVFSLTPELLSATAVPPLPEEGPEEFSPEPSALEKETATAPTPEYSPLAPSSLQKREETPPVISHGQSEPITGKGLAHPPSPKAKEPDKIFEDFDDPEDSMPFTVDAQSSPPPEQFSFAAEQEEKEEKRPHRQASSRPRSHQTTVTVISLWPVLGFLLLLVLVYHTLGSYSRAHIAGTETTLARLPLIGSSFVESQFSIQHIALSNLKSEFWITKDNKRVFAVSGKATNNASVPASTIQIEGQLHDRGGKTVGQQTIFCGMGTTADNLPTMTTNEIDVLQNLIPPKQFHVPPKESVDFLMVFADPPQAVTELSFRVAHAQFGRS